MKKAVFISLGIGIFFFSFIFFPFLIEYVNKPTATFTSEYYSPNCLLKCSQEFEYKLQQQREEEEEEKEDEKLKSSYEKQQIKDENNYENELEKYKNKLREQIKEEIKEEIREEYQKINEKKPKKTAIITMLTTETYVDGARALGWSLHASNTKSDKILLHIGNLSSKNKCLLEQAKWELRKVERIPPPNSNLISEHFNDTFTKLHTWNLKEYEKIIFLDADTIVASNFEELFEISGNFAAGSDFFYNIGETKTFNSGVMLITPDRFVFDELIVLKENLTFYDVGWTDQGLLNAYYKYKFVFFYFYFFYIFFFIY